MKHFKRIFIVRSVLFLPVVILLFFIGCVSGPIVTVTQPAKKDLGSSTSVLKAGAGEVDITPPPGLPFFGYSREAAGHAVGYWTRLKSRAIVFEYYDSNRQKIRRLALVQLDLGAVSGLLHRQVARRLAGVGFSPGDILLAASHTHGAPGGYFGAAFYNLFASGKRGFYPQLVKFLSQKIAKSVTMACNDLAPARVAAGKIRVPGLSRNRSLEAWIWNFAKDPTTIKYPAVMEDVYLLRVDHLFPNNPYKTLPIAAFIVTPVHPVAMGKKNRYYHGDLTGIASRYVSQSIMFSQRYMESYKRSNRSFVAAVCVGPQGDVSPDVKRQDRSETCRLGRLLADKVEELFFRLNDQVEQEQRVKLNHNYHEVLMPGASVSGDKQLCPKPMVGVPVLGGTEDGRSHLYGKFSVLEGMKYRKPRGCHGVKIPAGGIFQRLIVKPRYLPDTCPLMLTSFGDMLAMATVPVEPTTEAGRRIRASLKEKIESPLVALVAVANEYISYLATFEEYSAQHFEGAFTLYGPNETEFFQQEVSKLALRLDREIQIPYSRSFFPGKGKEIFRIGQVIQPRKWKSLTTEVKRDALGNLKEVRFKWLGFRKNRFCTKLPAVKVIRLKTGQALTGPGGMAETDDWLNFKVRRWGRRTWSAVWTPPDGLIFDGPLQIVVERSLDLQPLTSEPFYLTKKGL